MAEFKQSILISLKDAVSPSIIKTAKSIARFRKGAKADLRRVGAEMDRLKARSASLRSGIGKLAVASGAALTAGFVASIREGANFEDAIASLSAITGATGKDLASLTKASKEFGVESAIAATDVAKSFELVASAKPELLKNIPALKETTRQILILSNASGLDLVTSTNAATLALNQFGLGGDEAARVVNALAAANQLGSSSIEDTSQALKNVGTVANSAGLSLETTVAAIGTLSDGGLKAAEAGTALRGVILKLEASGVKRLMPSVVGLSTAMESLKDMNLNATQATKLFGLEGISAFRILEGQTDRLKELETGITGTSKANELAEKKLSTLNAQFRRTGVEIKTQLIDKFNKLKPQLLAFADQFQNQIVPAMSRFIDKIFVVVDNLGGLAGVVQKVATIIAAKYAIALALSTASMIKLTAAVLTGSTAQAAFATVAGITGGILSKLGLIQAAVAVKTGLVTAAQWLLNAALTANPIGLVIVGIGALIAAGVALVKNWDTVKNFFVGAWEIMMAPIKSAIALVKELLNLLPDSIKSKIGLDSDIELKIKNIEKNAGTQQPTAAQAAARNQFTSAPSEPFGLAPAPENNVTVNMTSDSRGNVTVDSVKSSGSKPKVKLNTGAMISAL